MNPKLNNKGITKKRNNRKDKCERNSKIYLKHNINWYIKCKWLNNAIEKLR